MVTITGKPVPSVVATPATDGPPVPGRPHRLAIAAGVTAVAGALALSTPIFDSDAGADTLAALMRVPGAVARFVAGIGWAAAAVLVAVSVIHYLAAAMTSRAAAGVPLPRGELVCAQFAASAANRITPAGLGGAGLLARFFGVRGGLSAARATAAVAAVGAFGGVADVAAFAALVGLSVALGVPGAAGEVPQLLTRLTQLVPFATTPVVLVLIASVAVAGAAVVKVTRRGRGRRHASDRVADEAKGFGRQLLALARHPGRLAALMSASAVTTLVLSVGFAAAAVLGPTRLPAHMIVALMIGYMVAAAAGNALPTPGGIGTADAAFVGVLVAAHAGAAPALAVVLAFRAVTFWAPAAVGVVAARRLRRAGAL